MLGRLLFALCCSTIIGPPSIPLQAQGRVTGTVQRWYDLIGIDQGLSQGMVSAIVQDTVGFLWASTKDGLDRYDGYGFRVFRHDPDDPTSLAESHTEELLIDAQQRLWVGTYSRGLDLFDQAREKFIHIKTFDARKTGGRDNGVSRLEEDPFGNVWVGFKGGGLHVLSDTRSASRSAEAGGHTVFLRPANQVVRGCTSR
ncbi:MAG: hypothetical protein KDB88_08705 [Flavobacteriales bacterium]|nr:hypothetical protein [Flavobacteriales bacterium]